MRRDTRAEEELRPKRNEAGGLWKWNHQPSSGASRAHCAQRRQYNPPTVRDGTRELEFQEARSHFGISSRRCSRTRNLMKTQHSAEVCKHGAAATPRRLAPLLPHREKLSACGCIGAPSQLNTFQLLITTPGGAERPRRRLCALLVVSHVSQSLFFHLHLLRAHQPPTNHRLFEASLHLASFA